ncbi:hypothetical protein B296_00026831 [Ensete ventricosum]|uniref:Uncharacterized protein n=1 Tax=Ensete ventricosum TaxID=4639 RepID=A0A426ZF02_ENSVE|nr:hypothetical protein B296_00026831 [Ensete ventricosum]
MLVGSEVRPCTECCRRQFLGPQSAGPVPDGLTTYQVSMDWSGLEGPLELVKIESPLELVGTESPLELVGTESLLELVMTKSSLELAGTESPLELVMTKSSLELAGTESPLELVKTESPLELVRPTLGVGLKASNRPRGALDVLYHVGEAFCHVARLVTYGVPICRVGHQQITSAMLLLTSRFAWPRGTSCGA